MSRVAARASTPKRPHEDSAEDAVHSDKRPRHEPSARTTNRQTQSNGYRASGLTNGISSGLTAPVEHQPGAIRRIRLKNFVTYRSVEFFPGPSLNMVIGPNGTGKSTLVCAICIGLGYDPKFLGRAKELGEFVKYGSSQAHIEIEVERPPARAKHPVFKCTIKRDDNKATYSLDDKPFSAKSIKTRAGKLGVQIDNLCQFLPQDRVVEFARLSSVQLLHETQRAVASQEMLDWHDTLKQVRKDQRALEGNRQDHAESLASLEAKHKSQEQDVQRIRERDEVQANVKDLEGTQPFFKYTELTTMATQKRQESKELGNEVRRLEASMEPFMQDMKLKDRYKKRTDAEHRRQNNVVQSKLAAVEEKEKEIEQLDGKLQGIENTRRAEKQAVKDAEGQSNRLAGVIRNLKAEARQPEPASQAEIDSKNENIRRCEREKREIDDVRTADREIYRTLEIQTRERQSEIQRKEEQISNLQSKSGQQAVKLRQLDENAYKAYEWLRRNKDKFEKEVFAPPLIECSVKDPRRADIVEAAIGKDEMIRFTAQTKKDGDTLRISLRQNGLAKINQRVITEPLTTYTGSVNQNNLRTHGLDGWILDLIEGPQAVLCSLCEGAKVHQTGYSLQELSDQQFEGLKESNMSRIMTPKTSYSFQRRREYGPGATNVVSKDMPKPRYWTDAPVDTSAMSGLRREINEKTDEIKELAAEMDTLRKEKAAQLKTRLEQLDNEIKTLRSEKDEMQTMLSRYKSLPTRISQSEDSLAGFQNTISDYRNRDRELIREGDELGLQRVQLSLAYADAVEELQIAYEDLQNLEIMRIEANSDLAILQDRHAGTQGQIDEKRLERDEAIKIFSEAREKVQAQKTKVEDVLRVRGKEEFVPIVRAFQAQYADVVALEAQIESQKARLDMLQGAGGSNTLADYERRERQINDLRNKLQQLDGAIQEMADRIKEVRDQWEPQLDKLVALISHSFSYNMNFLKCAGEVSVGKDEDDFDKWEIKVMVKFRENETLSQLNSNRQSGGERAVSTMFYLMSLQSLTRSPFRIVDEINQGMDPRNERLAHERMVAIATGTDEMPPPVFHMPRRRRERDEDEDGDDDEVGEEDDAEEEVDISAEGQGGRGGSQYFLITPKLLPDLKYQRGMRVLCIASGEHMPPAESKAVDFRRQLEIRRAALVAPTAG